MQNYLLVGLGGFLGAIARLCVTEYVSGKMGARFPYGTFLVNCSGCFAIGLIVTVLDYHAHWNSNWRYLLPVGFIGAYTTFSTFELETFRSLQQGEFIAAALNVALSLLLGFVFLYLGVMTGRAAARLPLGTRAIQSISCEIVADAERSSARSFQPRHQPGWYPSEPN
ncbi:MAG TPA: fluoride efflux transporter CrcB [Terriglobales bacterium]|nr:fluoride efflux transporter CrcB [Terriglobales bacterium]